MENSLVTNSEEIVLSDKEVFIKIWTSPKQILKYLHDNGCNKHVNLLLLLAGISRTFDRASLKGTGDRMKVEIVILICVIIGAVFGWLSYYIYAALVNWTGKWLKAEGDTKSLLNMFAYASIPSVIALLFLIPQIAVYGNEVFKSDGDISSAGMVANIFVYGSMFIEYVLAIYSIVLFVIGTAEVQKFSIGKAFLNLVLPALVIVVPFVILLLLFLNLGR